MSMRLLTLLLALAPVALASAQTGNEEAICRNDPNVFFCDNFEDRAVGPVRNDAGPRYKHKGWSTSAPDSPDVITSEHFTGSKSLRMTTYQNQTGGGFITSQFPVSSRTLYYRWYEKYSPNYVWSPIATKHNESDADFETDVGLFNFVGNQGFKQPVFTFVYRKQCWDSGITQGCWFRPNANGGFAQYNVNQWYCHEVHMTLNTASAATDGTLQAWIDGVLYWDYPNVNLKGYGHSGQVLNNTRHTGTLIPSYWNCNNDGDCTGPGQAHPTIYRYIDNIVASTARIGCLGGQPPPTALPSTPGTLQLQ
jgi:hypothetical protein